MKKLLFTLALFTINANLLFAQKTINLMTYNIRMDVKEDGENAWPNRKEDMIVQIKKYNTEILCVQEDAEKLAKFIEEKTKLKGTLDVRTRGTSGSYNGIYYNAKRFKVLDEGHFFLNEKPDSIAKGWDAAAFRMSRWVKFRDNKSKAQFYVFNTHFDHKGVEARKQSAHLAVAKIKEIAGDRPVVFTGDFNSKPNTEAIATIKNLMKDSREVTKKEPTGPVGTFNGFKLDNKLDARIDYIFVNGNLQVNSYDVYTDKSKTGNYISDHLPIMVNLTVKK